MKKIIYLLMLPAFFTACNSEPQYVIKADIQGSDSIKFYLQRRVDSKILVIDSAVSRKGKFTMKNSIDYPDLVQLTAMRANIRLPFYLENSEITIMGNLDSLFAATITGSKTQDEYKSLTDASKPLSEKYSALIQDYQAARAANDNERITQIEKDAEIISKQQIELQKEFVKNNPSSYVVPSVLRGLSYEMEADEIEAVINALDTNVAKIQIIRDLKVRVNAMKAVAIGQKAPDFTLNDVDGNPVALYSKVGAKLLLVDFWAAWCNPCRQENPNVVKVYNEFYKKGFDVFGVSLDRAKEDWVKAIEDDKLTWTHVSDLQYWSSAAAKLYAVNSIPANFLLDENGIIIGHNLREEALYEKVKEILGGK
jgi:peroxiredoxin